MREAAAHPHIHAFWELGSPALGRADGLSDLDLQLLVTDGHVEDGRAAAERALESIAPIEIAFLVPRPTWHGNWQAFYRLAGVSPYLLVDLCIYEESAANRFLEPEVHGKPAVYLDRKGWVAQTPSEVGPLADRLRQRLDLHGPATELFHAFVDKELARGRELDALQYYQGLLQRLVELLRMVYKPWQYNFGLRYLQHDLPPEIYGRVAVLSFVASAAELRPKKEQVLTWIRQILADLKRTDLEQHLASARDN